MSTFSRGILQHHEHNSFPQSNFPFVWFIKCFYYNLKLVGNDQHFLIVINIFTVAIMLCRNIILLARKQCRQIVIHLHYLRCNLKRHYRLIYFKGLKHSGTIREAVRHPSHSSSSISGSCVAGLMSFGLPVNAIYRWNNVSSGDVRTLVSWASGM